VFTEDSLGQKTQDEEQSQITLIQQMNTAKQNEVVYLSTSVTSVASVRDFFLHLPIQSTIFRDNSAKCIDITVGELLSKLMEIFPRIPLRANQFPGNSVAHLGCKVDAQSRGFLERHTTGIALLQRFLIEFFSDSDRTAFRISSSNLVFRAPGAIAFTSIENSLSSSAKVSVRRTTAALDAA
jgi:hypothetical protein